MPVKSIKSVFLAAAIILTCFASLSQTDHVGLWKGEDQGEVAYIELDSVGYAMFIIEGDTLGGRSFDMEGEKAYMLYDVVYGAPFNTINFHVMLHEYDMLMGMVSGIFKFDDKGRMVLCVNFEDGERLTEFKEDDTIVLERVTAQED